VFDAFKKSVEASLNLLIQQRKKVAAMLSEELQHISIENISKSKPGIYLVVWLVCNRTCASPER